MALDNLKERSQKKIATTINWCEMQKTVWEGKEEDIGRSRGGKNKTRSSDLCIQRGTSIVRNFLQRKLLHIEIDKEYVYKYSIVQLLYMTKLWYHVSFLPRCMSFLYGECVILETVLPNVRQVVYNFCVSVMVMAHWGRQPNSELPMAPALP